MKMIRREDADQLLATYQDRLMADIRQLPALLAPLVIGKNELEIATLMEKEINELFDRLDADFKADLNALATPG